MSSSRVAINRIVITGRAVTDPVKKTVNTHRGEATLSTFAIRTAKDSHVGSVIMEIQAWERTAGQTNHLKKAPARVPRTRRSPPDTHSHPSRPPPATRRVACGGVQLTGTTSARRGASHGCVWRTLGYRRRSIVNAKHARGATSHNKQMVMPRATATVTPRTRRTMARKIPNVSRTARIHPPTVCCLENRHTQPAER